MSIGLAHLNKILTKRVLCPPFHRDVSKGILVSERDKQCLSINNLSVMPDSIPAYRQAGTGNRGFRPFDKAHGPEPAEGLSPE